MDDYLFTRLNKYTMRSGPSVTLTQVANLTGAVVLTQLPRNRPRPLVTHRGYPVGITPEEKTVMTIAAGFRVRDGVLLCADTEYSGGSKIHKEKIVSHHFSGGSVAFAIAGHGVNAGMCIRDCRYALKPHGAAPSHSPEQVDRTI